MNLWVLSRTADMVYRALLRPGWGGVLTAQTCWWKIYWPVHFSPWLKRINIWKMMLFSIGNGFLVQTWLELVLLSLLVFMLLLLWWWWLCCRVIYLRITRVNPRVIRRISASLTKFVLLILGTLLQMTNLWIRLVLKQLKMRSIPCFVWRGRIQSIYKERPVKNYPIKFPG